jgi:hypothetical protein
MHYDFEQSAATVFGGYAAPSGWSVRLAAGAILGGQLDGDEMPGTFDMGRGFVGSVSGARRWALGEGRWFVTGSTSITAGSTTTSGAADERLTAFDVRIGAIAGRTFADVVSPYVLTRVFGGPVLWTVAGDDVAGSDPTHLQLGAGVSIATAYGLSAVIDVSVVGEQSASVGVSWRL